ncbi:MAG: asparaginase [Burkholderiales bacterium]|nr:asparaginase [Burkholderiales bacterium]
MPSTIVILGTGGTIAGTAATPTDNTGYTAAQRSVADLVAAVPALAGRDLESEQVAQLDSKDMDFATWQRLAQRAARHLARPAVAGVVVTHGTDTLEETAWFLHRVLAPSKPLVLTAAMRPATALQADGPSNLLDAVTLAATDGARGVLLAFGGAVYGAEGLRKVHPYRLDAFSSGDAGVIGWIEDGRLRRQRDWPGGDALGLACIASEVSDWPRVEIVASHAGASGALVDVLCADGVDGLVVAATGNGSVHRALDAALDRARAAGVTVWLSTRCAFGRLVGAQGNAPAAALSPWQARVELMLRLLGDDG